MQDKQPDPNSFEMLTSEEKAAVWRARLYATHKPRASLGTYYQLFPDERPRARRPEEETGRQRG